MTANDRPAGEEVGRRVARIARCESCGRVAEVVLADDSTWCMPCHASALNLGYDTDLGTLLTTGEPPTDIELVEVGYVL